MASGCLPIGGTYAVEVGLFAFAALCMGTMGSTQLAAHQIALQIGPQQALAQRIGVVGAVVFDVPDQHIQENVELVDLSFGKCRRRRGPVIGVAEGRYGGGANGCVRGRW